MFFVFYCTVYARSVLECVLNLDIEHFKYNIVHHKKVSHVFFYLNKTCCSQTSLDTILE